MCAVRLIFLKKYKKTIDISLLFCYYIQALSERHSSLAQSVEHSAVNRVVVGSSPTGGAIWDASENFPNGKYFRMCYFFTKSICIKLRQSLLGSAFCYSLFDSVSSSSFRLAAINFLPKSPSANSLMSGSRNSATESIIS